MSTLHQTTKELLETHPDVKAFIYQQMVEFDPFVSPNTKVTVIAKNPKKKHSDFKGEDETPSVELHRIAVVLSEDGASIKAEGSHQNIFTAIQIAKENLIQKLIAIQDSVISPQERQMAINQALQNNSLH